MAEPTQNTEEKFQNITECPICTNAFTDPRMLPCVHTVCFQCLKSTSEAAQQKPGDKIPCPLCSEEFTIPEGGIDGMPRNIFMESFLATKSSQKMGNTTILCDLCNARNEGKTRETPIAAMRCLECQAYYCESCVNVHRFQKLQKLHQVIKIGGDNELGLKRPLANTLLCDNHSHKPLDYYCFGCKKIVCVSCFVEDHASHKCKDVTTVDGKFRQMIEKEAYKMSTSINEMLLMRDNNVKRKADFLREIDEKEKEIRNRNQKLKYIIDRHTKSLLDELSVIKSKHLKEMENQMAEIETQCTRLRNFQAYCTELRLKRSASDICRSIDELLVGADEIDTMQEALNGHPPKLVEVAFQETDLRYVLQSDNVSNFVGNINEILFENCAIVVGLSDGLATTKDVVKINLRRSNEVSKLGRIWPTLPDEVFAAVYCNTMYVTGVGLFTDQIWKYSQTSGWKKCGSLVQGRRRHSAAFVDEVLYICGGFKRSSKQVLDSVEAFNAVTNKCTSVGKLVHGVMSSGNCVPFKGSLYIFGGANYIELFNGVQVYNTKENTCSVRLRPMPRPFMLMGAVLWETSVILLGRDTCFLFNIETKTWQEREQFKADVSHFGLIIENERIFVVGGGIPGTDTDGKTMWKCIDDVRYVPLQNILQGKPTEWKIHGKLPKPSLVYACTLLRFFV